MLVALLPSLLLLLVGGLTVLAALQLPIGGLRAPGSGLFPLILGLLLMGLSAGHCLRLLGAAPPAPRPGSAPGSAPSPLRAGLFLGAVVAATALLHGLGFLLTAFLLLLALMEILGVRPRGLALLVALLVAIASHALFVLWLQIPLPKGWIGL